MEVEVIFQLFLATFLGALIGLEREIKRKGAGLRTYSLVSLGTCLFTLVSFGMFGLYGSSVGINFDPSRIIQAIAVGIGFIGAGVVFKQGEGIVGLTTAAGLWVTSAIGIAVGAKFYFLAIFTAFLSLLLLAGFGLIEEKILKSKEES